MPRILILCLFLLTACTPASVTASGPVDEAKLLKVVDGDTIVVALAGEKITVRLLAIDTPERNERGYEKATGYVMGWCEGRGPLRLEYETNKFDKYGRTLAWVWGADGRLLNRDLVRSGLARPFMLDKCEHPERVQ